MTIDIIVTTPPYAPFMDDVLDHPLVSGIRLNTVMPLQESVEQAITRLSEKTRGYGKDLWVDLKTRQLRVKDYGVPPFTDITLTHNISVDTPVKAYFSGGEEEATVLRAEGNRLIMLEGPKRVVGPGESVNIMHPSLKIEGYFTDKDKEYIAACVKRDEHHYMLSFVEGQEDITRLLAEDPKAVPMAKIESLKGLEYVNRDYDGKARLFTARGDLYVELRKPHHILQASENVLAKDPDAAVGSRILSSLAYGLTPSCADINDADNLIRMGYRTLMLGDEVCLKKESIMSALNLLSAISQEYA